MDPFRFTPRLGESLWRNAERLFGEMEAYLNALAAEQQAQIDQALAKLLPPQQ